MSNRNHRDEEHTRIRTRSQHQSDPLLRGPPLAPSLLRFLRAPPAPTRKSCPFPLSAFLRVFLRVSAPPRQDAFSALPLRSLCLCVEPNPSKLQAAPEVSNQNIYEGGNVYLASVIDNTGVRYVTSQLSAAPATVQFAGLVGVGLFQVNIIVSSDLADGEYQLLIKANGVSSQTGVIIPVTH